MIKPTLVVDRLALSFQVRKIVYLVHSQIKPNYKIGTCGFFVKNATLRCKRLVSSELHLTVVFSELDL